MHTRNTDVKNDRDVFRDMRLSGLCVRGNKTAFMTGLPGLIRSLWNQNSQKAYIVHPPFAIDRLVRPLLLLILRKSISNNWFWILQSKRFCSRSGNSIYNKPTSNSLSSPDIIKTTVIHTRRHSPYSNHSIMTQRCHCQYGRATLHTHDHSINQADYERITYNLIITHLDHERVQHGYSTREAASMTLWIVENLSKIWFGASTVLALVRSWPLAMAAQSDIVCYDDGFREWGYRNCHSSILGECLELCR